MDTADNRNYGLPRRGGTKGCSTAKDRTGTSFDNLTFYEGTVPKEERLACKAFHSLPSLQIEGRRKPFVPPFFSLPMLQTVDYDYRDFIGRIFLRMLYRFLFLHIGSFDNLLSPLDNFAKSFLPRRKNISGAQTFAWTKFYYIE